jgi:transposase
MNICSTCTHGISRQLKISRRCIRQAIRKFDEFNTVATKPGGGRPRKVTDRDKRLIKLQQLRDDTLSLPDLVRYAHTELNLSISSSTISRILREYNLVSFIAPRKPQISPKQRRARLEWCYAHLNWSVEDWSRVIFSDESNYEVLNRKNRLYIRRFRNDRTRFQRFQKRVHQGGGICTCTTYIHLSNEHIYQVNECLLEIQDKFSSMI